MSGELSHRSVSKTQKVTCRVPGCRKILLKQNYRDHLRNVHPDEDPLDLRVLGEQCFPGFGTRSCGGGQRQSGSSYRNEADQVEVERSEFRSRSPLEERRSRSPEDVRGSSSLHEGNDDDASKTNLNIGMLKRRMVEVDVMRREELLDLATTLVEVKESPSSCHVVDRDTVSEMLARVLEELGSSRIKWNSLAREEQQQVEDLASIDPNLAVLIIQTLFHKVNVNEARDENSNMMPSKQISEKIEKIARKVAEEVDISACANETEVALKKLQVIDDNVNMVKEIQKLENVVVSLKASVGVRDEAGKMGNTDQVLTCARSLQEITEKICEYEYREFKDGGVVVCIICGENFKYSNMFPQDYSGSKVATRFSNLKQNLKNHLSSQKHKKKALELNAASLIDEKEESRNSAVSLRIGRLCFYIYKQGRPFTDLPLLIHINIANGCDLGDLNHSK